MWSCMPVTLPTHETDKGGTAGTTARHNHKTNPPTTGAETTHVFSYLHKKDHGVDTGLRAPFFGRTQCSFGWETLVLWLKGVRVAAEPYGRLEKAPWKKSLGTLNTTLSGMGCTLSF